MSLKNLFLVLKGSAGSGNWAHDGRPGKIGGSARGGGLIRLNLPRTSTPIERKGVARVRTNKKKFLDADPQFRKQLEDITDELCKKSPPQCEGLHTYTTNSYAYMNQYLRGQRDTLDESLQEAVKEIDKAFDAASPLSKNVQVSRYVSSNFLENLNLRPGDIFEDKAFVSTDYGNARGNELQIFVPKGAKAIYLDKISDYPGERELLLPRGSRFKVLDSPNPTEVALELIIDE